MKGITIDPALIFTHCRNKLEKNAVPSYLQVVDAIPKSASEKNLDRLLKDDFSKDAENVYAFDDYR
jgi:acyl-coenzyme A synthetase/AMP-(fatty) acid ligase